jgi:hypothetical protein
MASVAERHGSRHIRPLPHFPKRRIQRVGSLRLRVGRHVPGAAERHRDIGDRATKTTNVISTDIGASCS